MLRLGFSDDDLDNYHANTYLGLARTAFADRVRVIGCCALQAERGRAWALRNQVAWYEDAERLGRDIDAWMVLAPSTPGSHPELCARVLPQGKPTWVDKTFAADLAAARAIFALADRHHAPIQTSSALRYSGVQRAVAEAGEPVLHVAAWGGGRSFAEYAIHPLELAVSLLGPAATCLHRRGTADYDLLAIGFADGRSATVHVHCGGTPFAAAVTTARTTRWLPVDGGTLFADAFAGALDFLVSGRPHIDRRESLAIRALIDAAERPAARDGFIAVAA